MDALFGRQMIGETLAEIDGFFVLNVGVPVLSFVVEILLFEPTNLPLSL